MKYRKFYIVESDVLNCIYDNALTNNTIQKVHPLKIQFPYNGLCI